MTKNCKTCAFWQFFDCAQEDESEDDDVDLGFCCRHPPIFIGVQPDARPYSPHNWEQPVTTNRDWCGDWALRTKTPALTGDESRPAQQAAGPTYTITQTWVVVQSEAPVLSMLCGARMASPWFKLT